MYTIFMVYSYFVIPIVELTFLFLIDTSCNEEFTKRILKKWCYDDNEVNQGGILLSFNQHLSLAINCSSK